MSTWVVQVAVVVLFALACGGLAAAWMWNRLGTASIVLFIAAVVTWVLAFVAIASEFRDANNFATCAEACTTAHYVTAVAFIVPPLLVSLAALAMIVASGHRWRLRRAGENHL
jgi:hypothetical protein